MFALQSTVACPHWVCNSVTVWDLSHCLKSGFLCSKHALKCLRGPLPEYSGSLIQKGRLGVRWSFLHSVQRVMNIMSSVPAFFIYKNEMRKWVAKYMCGKHCSMVKLAIVHNMQCAVTNAWLLECGNEALKLSQTLASKPFGSVSNRM